MWHASALSAIDAAGISVTFESVARAAGVSRSWLYTQPDIRDEVLRLRDLGRRAPGTPVPARHRSSDASLVCRLQGTTARKRELAQDNQRMRHRLAQALGELRAAATPGPWPASQRSRETGLKQQATIQCAADLERARLSPGHTAWRRTAAGRLYTGNLGRPRRRANGDGSHAAVVRAPEQLTSAHFRYLPGGLLCTIYLCNGPVRADEAPLRSGPPTVDFLLPHDNWLAAIFDRWQPMPRQERQIRLYAEVMKLLAGQALGYRLTPAGMVVIETDGSIEQVDSLKQAYGLAQTTGLPIRRSTART